MNQFTCNKTKVYLVIFTILMALLILNISCQNDQQKIPQNTSDLKGTISISGAFALYPLTVKWAEEFQKIHPAVRIDVSAGGAGKGLTDALSGMVDLGMVSRAITPAEEERGVWWVAVTKDAVLPTISASNPVLTVLKEKGLTRQDFLEIYIDNSMTIWGKATDTPNNDKINVYTRSDACGAAQTWAAYLGGSQESLKGVGVFGDPGLADAVKNDPQGIGFNNTIYIYNQTTKAKYEGLEVIPIDINENGLVDAEENFYDSMDQVIDAIATGKYPSPPARELNLVAKGQPSSPLVVKFLNWILTEGQKFVLEAGYVPLEKNRILTELEKLSSK